MRSYHYTESGLDTVYLVNGYEFVSTPRGKLLRIRNVDGLHKAIGKALVGSKGSLAPKQVRFLRVEIGMTQLRLARMLGVTDQTVARWEKGMVDIPQSADAALRALYVEWQSGENARMTELLREISDDEHGRSERIELTETRGKWAA